MPVRSVLLIVLGLVVFWDAKKRGYSLEYALLWGLGTAAFVPVALVYLLWGRGKAGKRKRDTALTQKAEGQEPLDVSQKVTCPRCASDVPESFSRCPHCGMVLKPTCPDCGQPIPADKAGCPHCGGAEEKSSDEPPFLKS